MQSVLILPLLYSRFRLIPRRERHEARAGAPYKRRWAIAAIDLYDVALTLNRQLNNRKAQDRRKMYDTYVPFPPTSSNPPTSSLWFASYTHDGSSIRTSPEDPFTPPLPLAFRPSRAEASRPKRTSQARQQRAATGKRACLRCPPVPPPVLPTRDTKTHRVYTIHM